MSIKQNPSLPRSVQTVQEEVVIAPQKESFFEMLHDSLSEIRYPIFLTTSVLLGSGVFFVSALISQLDISPYVQFVIWMSVAVFVLSRCLMNRKRPTTFIFKDEIFCYEVPSIVALNRIRLLIQVCFIHPMIAAAMSAAAVSFLKFAFVDFTPANGDADYASKIYDINPLFSSSLLPLFAALTLIKCKKFEFLKHIFTFAKMNFIIYLTFCAMFGKDNAKDPTIQYYPNEDLSAKSIASAFLYFLFCFNFLNSATVKDTAKLERHALPSVFGAIVSLSMNFTLTLSFLAILLVGKNLDLVQQMMHIATNGNTCLPLFNVIIFIFCAETMIRNMNSAMIITHRASDNFLLDKPNSKMLKIFLEFRVVIQIVLTIIYSLVLVSLSLFSEYIEIAMMLSLFVYSAHAINSLFYHEKKTSIFFVSGLIVSAIGLIFFIMRLFDTNLYVPLTTLVIITACGLIASAK